MSASPAGPEPSPAADHADPVPAGVRTGAAYTWRMLVIAAGITAVLVIALWLAEVVVPFLIALVLSALLVPFAAFLQRHHWPKWVAVITAWLLVFAALTAVVAVVTEQVRSQLPDIEKQVSKTIESAQAFLATEPFGLTTERIQTAVTDVVGFLQAHAGQIGSGFAAAGIGLVHTIAAVFIVVFVTLFALIDGRTIWLWVTRLFPRRAQPRILVAGDAGWHTLTSFIRVQLVVAGVDAVGIGVGAAMLGVPLAIPIAVVVFFGAFVPVVGAIVGGALAVGMALLFNGWLQALIMLVIVLGVQLFESHVLHPLLTGSAVRVHPVGVVLGVATGAAVGGIAGAFFAVPLIATTNAMIVAAKRHQPDEAPAPDAPTVDTDPAVAERDLARARRHLHVALLRATEDPTTVLAASATSGDAADARDALIGSLGVDAVQADAILDLPVRRLTPAAADTIRAELDALDRTLGEDAVSDLRPPGPAV